MNWIQDLKENTKVKTEAQKIISDDEVETVHANANFGSMKKRDVLNLGVLKCYCGYYQGYTSRTINIEHGLISQDYKVTEKGRKYLVAVYGEGVLKIPKEKLRENYEEILSRI